jgi:hypothetical protein
LGSWCSSVMEKLTHCFVLGFSAYSWVLTQEVLNITKV